MKPIRKQTDRITRIHTRIANCRRDFLHKHSTEISKNHAVIVVQDVQVAHMSRSAKGTGEEPGRGVAAKAGLHTSILDQGWGMLRTMLEDKQAWRGDTVLAVSPRDTSQRCVECGDAEAANRVQQALFSCKMCGHSYHAAINTARNILAAGQADR